MPVDATHPAYAARSADWKLLRDCVEGETAVKAAGEAYLPRTLGMVALGGAEGTKAYTDYQARATFPELLEPAVRGLVGVVDAKPATVALPAALEPVRFSVTNDGVSLEDFHRRMLAEVLTTGRFGILVGLPETGLPYLAGYSAEAILNWDEAKDLDGRKRPSMVALNEGGSQRAEDDFTWGPVESWRSLHLVDGRYEVRTYGRNPDGLIAEAGERVRPERNGKGLAALPFVFVGSLDLTPDVDPAPLLGLARLARTIYRGDADYRQALFMTSQPTPVLTGVDPERAPTSIGASAFWVLPENAKAQFLEFSGAGIAAQRQAINDDFARAVAAGARMLDQAGSQAESGEALRLRFAAQTATLTSVSKATASALEAALEIAASWIGTDPNEVSVEPNLDFLSARLAATEVLAFVQAKRQGAPLSAETLHDLFRLGGVTGRSYADETALLTAEMPAPAAANAGDEDAGLRGVAGQRQGA